MGAVIYACDHDFIDLNRSFHRTRMTLMKRGLRLKYPNLNLTQ